MRELRVAIIGCGCIHKMHTTAATVLEQSRLIAVCDIKDNRARESGTYYHVPFYTDYKEMIEVEKPDVVHICTPHYLHTIIAQYALEHGVNVLSEKPMGIRYSDAVDTVKIAEKNNKKYGVIFQCRYNDASVFLKERIMNGSLGKILSARAVLTWDRSGDYYTGSDWKGTIDKEGGGVLIDQAIHSLDLMNWLIDSEIEMVDVSLSNHNHDYILVEDTAEGFLTYKNGSKAMFWATTCYSTDEPIEIRLHCENGTVRLTYDDAIIRYNNGQELTITQRNSTIDDYLGGKQCWGLSHKVQIEQFYNSIIGNYEPEISGKEVLKTQKLMELIYRSGREKRRIWVDKENI